MLQMKKLGVRTYTYWWNACLKYMRSWVPRTAKTGRAWGEWPHNPRARLAQDQAVNKRHSPILKLGLSASFVPEVLPPTHWSPQKSASLPLRGLLVANLLHLTHSLHCRVALRERIQWVVPRELPISMHERPSLRLIMVTFVRISR